MGYTVPMDTSKPIRIEDIVADPKGVASLTTRHLKVLYDRLRTTNETIYHYDYDGEESMAADVRNIHIAMRLLKDELDKRPHIPNKKEGKALRRAAAKRGR